MTELPFKFGVITRFEKVCHGLEFFHFTGDFPPGVEPRLKTSQLFRDGLGIFTPPEVRPGGDLRQPFNLFRQPRRVKGFPSTRQRASEVPPLQ